MAVRNLTERNKETKINTLKIKKNLFVLYPKFIIFNQFIFI